VATISGRGGVRLLCPFGPGRAQAAYTISTFELSNQLKYKDPAGFAFDSMLDEVEDNILQAQEQGQEVGGKEISSPGGEADIAAMEQLRDALRISSRANDRTYTALIANYIGVLKILSEGLGSLRGRKNIVLFSEGFNQENLTGQNLAELQSQSEAWSTLNANNATSANISVRQSQQDLLSVFQDVLREFSRDNAVFYVVDVSRFSSEGDSARRRSGQAALYQFADETNGQLYSNLNDLGTALDDIAEKTAAGYLVLFRPSRPGKPGEFRKISIRVKRPGLNVNHQAGYTIEKLYRDFTPAEKQLQLAEFIVKDIVSDHIPFRFDAVAFEGDGRLARVPVIVEIDGKGLTQARGKRKQKLIQAEIYGYLLGENNTPVDFFFDYVSFTKKEEERDQILRPAGGAAGSLQGQVHRARQRAGADQRSNQADRGARLRQPPAAHQRSGLHRDASELD